MYKETYDDGGVLDPENPVTLTIWHYYNGAYQATFDKLVEEFNNSAGKDLGIYVEEMLDLFSAYTDSALGLQKDGLLTDLNQYFTAEELDKYVDAYVQEGEFAGDGGLCVFPVAKSTEITMMNKTDWDKFAEETGATLDDLSTVEGIGISSRLVQLVESDIVLESEPGEGSEFSFTLQMEFAREKKKEQKDCREMPIIAMSANAFEEDVKKSMASGMNEHLSKPLNIGKLQKVLIKYLKI